MRFCLYLSSCVQTSRKCCIQLTRPSVPVRTPTDQFLDRRRREIEAHQRSNAPAPEPTYLPVTSAQPNPTVAVATVIEVVPQSGMPVGMQAHEGHAIEKGGGKAGWSQDKSLSEQLAELNHAKEAVRDSY